MLQQIGRQYVREFNYRYHRMGSLWAGRYHSCLIDSESYLIKCQHNIDYSAVMYGEVAKPYEYQWSSCARYCGFNNFDEIIPHEKYLQLGNSKQLRIEAYLQLLCFKPENSFLLQLQDAIRANRPLGSKNFIYWLENEFNIELIKKKPGRPSFKAR